MKKKERPVTAGIGYRATICPSHLSNDPELREMFKPGEVIYYPESIEILEDEEVVLIGVIPVSSSNGSDVQLTAVQMAKLNFSQQQFSGLLASIPGLYNHFMRRLRKIDPSIKKNLSYKQVHKKLKESCLSSQNAFEKGVDFAPEYVFIGDEDED